MALGVPIWILIAILVVILLALSFKAMHQVYILSILKNNFFYFVVILLVAFVVYSVVKIHTTHDFDYSSSEGFKELGRVYYSWLANIFSNMAKTTGYVINQEWVVTETNSTSEEG